jgi:hypothetical protein
MHNHNSTPEMSVVAGSALAPNLRVKWHSTAGQVVVAGDEACIGVTINRAFAAGDPITIKDIRSPGSLPFTAGGAIAKGAAFTSAAAGKVVTGTGGNEDYGVALTAAGGDGEFFEGTPAK